MTDAEVRVELLEAMVADRENEISYCQNQIESLEEDLAACQDDVKMKLNTVYEWLNLVLKEQEVPVIHQLIRTLMEMVYPQVAD